MPQHLNGRVLPAVDLPATEGRDVDLSQLHGLTIAHAYPRTGPPDGTAIPGGPDIPGAQGCTPQSCGLRDHRAELKHAGDAHAIGVSTQSTAYQSEAISRWHLPFSMLPT